MTDSPELMRLAELGHPNGPSLDEALRLFGHLRNSPEEFRAIKALLAREAQAPLPDPLLMAVAAALVDRGEDASAEQLLRRGVSAPSLVLRAELRERAGDLPEAVALLERAMLRDIDWPGARERLARARSALGLPSPRRSNTDTTIAASAAQTPFRLVREVARGGAGTVFEAEDVDLGRRVALKVYHRVDRDREQLMHEARVAAALSGPGVVRVFDVDPEQGWLAMEWTELGALRSRLGVPLGRWAASLARALARVHGAGWVHHDVKPANVLMRSEGDPILSDFGTARRFGEPSPPGSQGYISPERMAGRNSDARDDIYGYGRVIEDACSVQYQSQGESPDDARPWLRLAALCTGPDEERPRDAADLVARIPSG
jgi:serine/threonine-protein kinase